jgi:alkylation response protein AidB-like acyl-CoA dehydrogenase
VNFEFDHEQNVIVETARRFFEKELREEARRWRDELIPKHELKRLLGLIQPFGFLGALLPEESGGRGIDFLTVIRLYEELSRIFLTLAGPAFCNEMVAYAIYCDGSDELRKRYLPGLLSGELIGSQAATEPETGSNMRAVRMRASDDGDGYRLNGRKIWISNGSVADVCIAVVRGDDGNTMRVVVDREPNGFSARELPTIGQHGFSTAELTFDNCWIPKSHRLGDTSAGADQTLRDFTIARCFATAFALGLSQAAFEAACAYCGQRKQWGKLIGQHQLVQEMIADMAVDIASARLLSYRAAWCVEHKKRSDTEASMAKYYATEAAVRVCSKAIQVHGAIGLSRDLPVEGYFRDARMLTIPDGTSQIQKLIIARNILGMSAFGDSKPAAR